MIIFRNDWRTFSHSYGWTELTLIHASAEWDRMFKRVEFDIGIAGFRVWVLWQYGDAAEMEAMADDLARKFTSYNVSEDPDYRAGGSD